MKIESLVESISRISEEEQKIKEHFGEDSRIFFFEIESEIASLKTALLSEQHRREAVKAGSNDAYKAFCSALKNASNDRLRYGWKDGENRLCACNGFIAVRLTNANFSVPMSDKPAINLDTLFDSAHNVARIVDTSTPSVADLKTYQKMIIAEYKAKYSAREIKNLPNGIPHFYSFENGPIVNTEYLISVLEMIPDAVFQWSSNRLASIYARGEAGEALVMPCAIRDEITVNRIERDSAALRSGTYFAA